MKDELKELKLLRVEIESEKINKRLAMEKYMQTPEYQEYLKCQEELAYREAKATELEKLIREEALDMSLQTGFTERIFGPVQIKEFTVVNITDKRQALAWAAQNAPSCLSLSKDFDRAVKSLELPFVSIEKEYRAQISSNLSDMD